MLGCLEALVFTFPLVVGVTFPLVKFKRIFLNYLILNEIIRYYIEMKGFWNK